jgi:hypothetical protein
MSKKRKPGRPAKPTADKQRNKVFAKLTDAERDEAESKATAANLPLSSWIRVKIIRAKK